MSSEEERSDGIQSEPGAFSSEASEWTGDEEDDSQSSSEASENDIHDKDEDKEKEKWSKRRGQTILWLCQEGQIRLARKRFDFLRKQEREGHGKEDRSKIAEAPPDRFRGLQREVFQFDRGDKNYALHELLMGGTSDSNAYRLVLAILDYARGFPEQEAKLLSVQPPSHGRTALHWAAWGNAPLEILQPLVKAYPQALLVLDRPRDRREFRTPPEIAKRYFGVESPRFRYLQKVSDLWKIHRVQHAVHLCVLRTFGDKQDGTTARLPQDDMPQPFSAKDRKRLGIKPRAWFPLSVVAYLFQREMKPLAFQILSFLGTNASVNSQTRTKRRKTQRSSKRTSNRKRRKV